MNDPADAEHSLLRSRAAVFLLFASFGLVLATWAVHLPTVQQKTGISTALLGTVLLVLGVGSLAGMQVCGPVIDRFGSGPVAVAGGCAMAATLPAPLAATTFWQIVVGAVIFGIAIGCADVAMNAAAVDVERDYGRPIMASFHAVFSIGNVTGSLVAAATFAMGLDALPGAAIVAVLGVAAVTAAGAILLPGGVRARAKSPVPHNLTSAADEHGTPSRRILILGVLAFLLLLSEGSAMDWSSLHAQQLLGASASAGALAFGSFVAAMTVGRFSVDRIVQRFGPVRVVRWGSVTAGAGLVVVIVSATLPLTILGWILFGLGLSGGIPQVFTAAGNSAGRSGRVLSRVVGLGYVAILAGPALIGWLAELTSLQVAFVLPLLAVVVCAASAGMVAAPVGEKCSQ
jgi:MFS family permease